MKQGDFHVFEPSEGFRVHVHPSKKFKSTAVRVHVHRPLGPEATSFALLPFVLQRGCRRYPTMRKITAYLEDLYGSSMSVDVLKMGERQVMTLRFDGVNDRFAPRRIGALRKSLEFLWMVLAKPVGKRGTLHAPYVRQEKENLKRFIEGMINDRGSYAFEQCLARMCADEPYGIFEYGKIGEIDAIRPAALAKLHARVLAESPVDLYVFGDVDPKKTAALAGRTFRFGRRKVVDPPPAVILDGPAKPREVVEKLEVEQGRVVMGFRTGIRWGDPDTFAVMVYSGLLGGYPHSKLFANVREREQLAYAVHSSVDTSKGLLFITAGIDPGKYAKCVAVIREQLAEMEAGRFTDDEWGKTQSTMVDRVRSREDHPASKIAAYSEMNLNGKMMTGPEVIRGIEAVTREDVVRVARRVRLDTTYFLTSK